MTGNPNHVSPKSDSMCVEKVAPPCVCIQYTKPSG